MKALVTGGAGFIGTNLCLALKNRGYEVVCFDSNHMERMKLFEQNDIEFLYQDVLDQDKLHQAARGVDVVFHLATMCLPYSLEGDPRYTLDVSDKGTYNAIHAARYHNAFFVYVSSSEVYGRGKVPMVETQTFQPSTIYGAAKAAGELVTTAYSALHRAPYLIARPFNCYGRFAREDKYATVITKMLKALIEGGEVQIHGEGKQTRDFMHIDDTVEGIISAFEGHERLTLYPIVNICTGRETCIEDLWGLCQNAYVREYPEGADGLMASSPHAKLVYGTARPGDIDRMFGHTWYADTMLKWKSKIRLEEGLKSYVRWLLMERER